MDSERIKNLKKKPLFDPILIMPKDANIDQEVIKKVIDTINTKVAPEVFKPTTHQTANPNKPSSPSAGTDKHPPKTTNEKAAQPQPQSNSNGKQKTPQKPAQETVKKEDIRKMLKSFMKIGKVLVMLQISIKSLSKLMPKIEKEIAQAIQKHKQGTPIWKFNIDLLTFATLREIEAVNDAVARWTSKKIPERVLVNEAVEVYLSVMYTKPPTEEQILADYPAGIMLQAIANHLPKDKLELLKKIVIDQITNHSQNSNMLESLQQDFIKKFQKEIAEFQKALQEELASKLASKLKIDTQKLQERLLGEDDDMRNIFDTMYTDGDFDLNTILGEMQDAFIRDQ